jgi:hypothetical protein
MQGQAWKRTFVAVAATVLAAGMASAKWFKSRDKSATVDIIQPAKVGNGQELQPGDYKVTLNPSSNPTEVSFYDQDGKLVAKAPAKLVEEGKKNDQTEVVFDTRQKTITEMRISGWNEKVVFSGSGEHSNAGT